MDYYQVKARLAASPAIRLLRSDSAAFVLSFCFEQFKQVQHDVLAYQTVLEALSQALENIHENEPDAYLRRAQDYLREWIDSGYLREYTNDQLERVVELTPHTERVLHWLEDLDERKFVGTESRLRRIFSLLEDISARSTEDATLRLQQLKFQRAEIEAEIQQIQETGKAKPATGREIREWFLEAESTARQMIGDFREIEEKFRVTARSVYAAQLDPQLRRGAVLGGVLNANRALQDSDQGRSFYAFYEFLSTRDRKEQFEEILRQAYALPDLVGTAQPEMTLRRFIWNMVGAAQKVRDQNNRLIDQLKRLLDSRALKESRRVRDLINDIKKAAVDLADSPPANRAFLDLDNKPYVQLMMDRELWQRPTIIQIDAQPLLTGSPDDFDALQQMFNAFYIDEAVLRERIDSLLRFSGEVTLQALLTHYPPVKGIPEVVAYLVLALNSDQHTITRELIEPLVIERYSDHQPVTLHLPRVTFKR